MLFAYSVPIDTADNKFSGYRCFRNTVMNNEHSLDYSNCTNNEGDTVVYLLFVMYCIIYRLVSTCCYNTWAFFSHVTDHCTSEPVHDDDDVIVFKEEPLEVSDNSLNGYV